MEKIIIYCDGGSRNGNGSKENYGSVASLIKFDNTNTMDYDSIIRKGFKDVTNNQMELLGFILPLTYLYKTNKNKKLLIKLFSDSQYLTKGINEWLNNWKRNNWKTYDKKSIKNIELWKIIDFFLNIKNFEFEINWVKGHNGNPLNEVADSLCTEYIQKMDSKEKEPDDFKHILDLIIKTINN